jgi:hypothetical protein
LKHIVTNDARLTGMRRIDAHPDSASVTVLSEAFVTALAHFASTTQTWV